MRLKFKTLSAILLSAILFSNIPVQAAENEHTTVSENDDIFNTTVDPLLAEHMQYQCYVIDHPTYSNGFDYHTKEQIKGTDTIFIINTPQDVEDSAITLLFYEVNTGESHEVTLNKHLNWTNTVKMLDGQYVLQEGQYASDDYGRFIIQFCSFTVESGMTNTIVIDVKDLWDGSNDKAEYNESYNINVQNTSSESVTMEPMITDTPEFKAENSTNKVLSILNVLVGIVVVTGFAFYIWNKWKKNN